MQCFVQVRPRLGNTVAVAEDQLAKVEVEDRVFRRPLQALEEGLLGVARLTDRLLDRAQGVVELAREERGVHAFPQVENQVEGGLRLAEVAVENPCLIVDGLDRVGLRLEHQVVLFDSTFERGARLTRVRLALGERQQEIAEVQVGGGSVQLGRGGLGVREGEIELAGFVEADRQCQDQLALVVTTGDFRGQSLGLGNVGRGGRLAIRAGERYRISINRATAVASRGLSFRSSVQTAIAAARSESPRRISASAWYASSNFGLVLMAAWRRAIAACRLAFF